MTKEHITLKLVKALIKELKYQMRENAVEMRHHAKGLDRASYAEAAHLDSVNSCLYYVIEERKEIVIHSK